MSTPDRPEPPDIAAALPAAQQQPYVTRLAGAGSLRRELEAVVDAAPIGAGPDIYKALILSGNAAGKDSAAMRTWVWRRLKVRYLLDPAAPEFRAFELAIRASSDPGERGLICFLMMARTDRLFREVTLETVSPHLRTPGAVINPDVVRAAIEAIRQRGRFAWTAKTVGGVVSHLLSSLKDFGLLEGGGQKRIAPVRPGPPTTVFAARLGRLEGLTDRQILASRWFQLLGLAEDQVVALLYTAARQQALKFQMQAGIVEISLPDLAAT